MADRYEREEQYLTDTISFRISKEIKELIEGLCFEDVAGVRVRVTDLSRFAREFFLRGMREYFEEKKMIEKYREVIKKEGVATSGN